MQPMWECADLDIMQDAAEAEAHVSLDGLRTPEQDFVTTMPYYGAFAEYRDHVAGCTGCAGTDCPEGEALRKTARVGLEEQARIALNN